MATAVHSATPRIDSAYQETGRKMRKLKRLLFWLMRAWPVLVPALLLLVHWHIRPYLGSDLTDFNKAISLALQILGGLLVIYSIDSDIGVVNNTSLKSVFIDYLKRCPLISKPVTLGGVSSTLPAFFESGKMRTYSTPKTLEEKFELLEKKICWLREDMDDELKRIRDEFSIVNKANEKKISEIRSNFEHLKSTFKELTVGGIKLQLFGVLLMIYGALSVYLV